MVGAQVHGAPVVGGAVEQERTERDQGDQQQAAARPCERSLAGPGGIPHEPRGRRQRGDQPGRGRRREVRAHMHAGGRGGSACQAARDEAERVAGVQPGKDRALVAALELDSLRVHGDIHDARGRSHHRERAGERGPAGRDRDRDQRRRASVAAHSPLRSARDERVPAGTPGERPAVSPGSRQPDSRTRGRGGVELLLDRPQRIAKPRCAQPVTTSTRLDPDASAAFGHGARHARAAMRPHRDPELLRHRAAPLTSPGWRRSAAIKEQLASQRRVRAAHSSVSRPAPSPGGRPGGGSSPQQESLWAPRPGVCRRPRHAARSARAGSRARRGALADLAGLRAGHVRLGSFFTALVYLSAEAAAVLEARHPELYRSQPAVIEDELVDRQSAFRGPGGTRLDVAIVFEHAFEPDPRRPTSSSSRCSTTPRGCCSRPVTRSPGRAPSVPLARVRPWIRAHRGSAARLVEHVLGCAGVRPPQLHAGHGDEPVEAQAFVAAGRGITLAHRLNVLTRPRPDRGGATCRRRARPQDPGGDHARAGRARRAGRRGCADRGRATPRVSRRAAHP